MSDTSLVHDYVQSIVRGVVSTTTYSSPMALFTSAPAVQWVKGNNDKSKIINFIADNITAEIISKTTTEIPLIGGRTSVFNWEHIIVANAIEHSTATEHQYSTKQNEVRSKIEASTVNMLRLIDAVALSNNKIGLFGIQNVNNGNYVKIDESYSSVANLYSKIFQQLDTFMGNNAGVVNVLLGSAITSLLRESIIGTKNYLEKVKEYASTGVNINFAENIVQYEASATLENCGVATAILPNEVHIVNPAKIKAYVGKDVEVKTKETQIDIETIKVSAGLTGLHAFDKNAIVKLSLTSA